LISCFKVLLIFCLFVSKAFAVQVEALYTSLCQRHVGITLYVDKRFSYFLNTDGQLKKIPRYQILSIASYPLDHFPLLKDVNIPEQMPQVRLWTLKKGELIQLGQGFVLGYNQSGFQLLTLQGHEVYISSDSIWRIEILRTANTLNAAKSSQKNYNFSHPQRGQCLDSKDSGVVVYPSDLISDPVSIKRRFDSQIAAFKKVQDYDEAQSFYAVPQIYKNFTSIGYWLPVGSRYGSSTGRIAGIAPLIRNEYSQGPFSFQHLSLTGAGPIPESIHEESQTMLYYGFKSSYVHFAGFIDPSLILAGANYQWQEDDLNGLDERAVESSYISLGFDRGPFSITFFLNSHIFGAFTQDGNFTKYTADLFRLGLGWRTSKLSLNFNTSVSGDMEIKNSSSEDWDGTFKFMKLSATYDLNEFWKTEAFFFSRQVSAEDSNSVSEFSGDSKTLGVGVYNFLTRRWMIGARLSAENVDNKSSNQNEKSKFLKSGLHASMNF
jgi:hypothetical protein